MTIIRRVAAHILLITVYGFTLLVAVMVRLIPRWRWKPTGRVMVTGTFFNPNWYLSHLTPLSRSGAREVILVVDEPQLPLERVKCVCPPRWVSRLLTRAGAKAIWMIFAGLRYRPDLYMGYHLAPGACSALVAGKLLGRPSCYQMTGGPVEVVGGGYAAIDSIEGSLGRPSRLIEELAIRVVRQFALVVVRGEKARSFLVDHGMKSVAVITGSVNGQRHVSQDGRDIDLIIVGRLSPVKQVHQFIDTVRAVRSVVPNVRAAIIGDGPLKTELQAYSERLGLSENIEFLGKIVGVRQILARSKVFVLTSQSEGLSIAMVEAMTAGVVPVVADVGELGDLVTSGVSGYLVEPNNIQEYAASVCSLLQDQTLWAQSSCQAVEAARTRCDIEVVTQQWRQSLQETLSRTSGCRLEDVFH